MDLCERIIPAPKVLVGKPVIRLAAFAGSVSLLH